MIMLIPPARPYRLRVENAGGTFTVEQQAFCDLTDSKITWLRVLCSGFVPVGGRIVSGMA
jgi:hypothetical protein